MCVCEGLSSEPCQEDLPMNDVILFEGVHDCKGSEIPCFVYDTLMNMHLYMHVMYYTWELLIFLDIKD